MVSDYQVLGGVVHLLKELLAENFILPKGVFSW
jgi:hypothetical protein